MASAERVWFEMVNAPLTLCHAKGAEHRAYRWARDGARDRMTEEQRRAYDRGFDGLPLLNDFARGYAETALELSDGEIGKSASVGDLHASALAQLVRECAEFEAANADALETAQSYLADAPLSDVPEAVCGYLFWLNRNGHGHGFWTYALETEGEDEAAFQRLDEASGAAGERDLYRGDDGSVYFSPGA